MLIDSVNITIQAGRGGDGVVAWRREKYIDKGGPAGGDGGRGGDVYIEGDHNVDTLSSFRFRKVFRSGDGEPGKTKDMHGKNGTDLILSVPVGTTITNSDTGQDMADIIQAETKIKIAKGGSGGLGNSHFASSTHRRPTESTPGQPGQKVNLSLELRMIADVAFIGQPNAGKSSLINCLTGAESRVGAYAFSTKNPVLGVMGVGEKKITLVDLPGLIEGAHQGKGMGIKFLRHAERVRYLFYVVDPTQGDSANLIKQLNQEINQFSDKLQALPRKIVFNKTDLLTPKELSQLHRDYPKGIFVSAKTKEGIDQLRNQIIESLA